MPASFRILEYVEQPAPTHLARVDQRFDVRAEALADVPRLPDFFPSVDGHVNQERRADNVFAGDEAPIAAVVRVFPIVAHHEIMTRRNLPRPAIFGRVRRLVAIGLNEWCSVDENPALPDIEGVARQPDDPLDEIRVTL